MNKQQLKNRMNPKKWEKAIEGVDKAIELAKQSRKLHHQLRLSLWLRLHVTKKTNFEKMKQPELIERYEEYAKMYEEIHDEKYKPSHTNYVQQNLREFRQQMMAAMKHIAKELEQEIKDEK